MTDEQFIDVTKQSRSMLAAAEALGIPFTSFKRKAEELGIYDKNQGAKGVPKSKPQKSYQKHYLLEDIFTGKFPNMSSNHLRRKLIKEGIWEDKCVQCGWGKKRPGAEYSACQLHHKNGDHHDHSKENLELLCPNCHSLTKNWGNQKRKEED